MKLVILAHPFLALVLLALVAIAGYVSRYIPARFIYTYPLVDQLSLWGYRSSHRHEQILRVLWMVTLALVALIIARPQQRDTVSTIRTDGIDIILALDISDSMNMVDDPANDSRKRIDIAKAEALTFIKNRNNDAVGLVLFAGYALSRCPLTLDKKIVQEIIEQTQIGLLDARATYLATGLITAANRMRGSNARSKIIILLTDGSPSEGDEDPLVAIEIARQLGIKVYTIAVGADHKIPCWNGRAVEYVSTYNKELLEHIAQQTGGAFFEASNSAQMRSIYQKIDALEKTEHQMELSCTVTDVFEPLVYAALVLLMCITVLSATVWFTV